MRKLNKTTAAIAGGALVVVTAGTAYAYWTTSGSGNGSATAGSDVTADAIKLLPVGTPSGMYPGGPAADISVKAQNPADFAQRVGEVTVTISDNKGCAFEIVPVTEGGLGDIAKKTTQADAVAKVVSQIKLNETGQNQDACKGAVPALSFASAPGA